MFIEESHTRTPEPAEISLEKWKEAVCRPAVVSWEIHGILGVRVLELVAGVLNLIKPSVCSVHIEGR